MTKFILLSFLAANFLFAACTSKTDETPSTTMTATTAAVTTSANPQADLVTKGKKVFAQNCIACHNPQPKLDGPIGPAIAGSSLELVTSRVLHATYPAGYKPKRTTTQMPALPSLEKEIPAIHAFLNQ